MSYRACFFGVRAIDSKHAGPQLARMAAELQGERRHDGFYLATNTDAEAAASGLRMMYLAVDPGSGARVQREFFTERWSGCSLFVASYDDGNGLFWWEHVAADGQTQAILTNGPDTGTSDIDLTVDYPQKGFTVAQLADASSKEPHELTREEARAVMEYSDAITIGLAQFGFTARRQDFLALLNAKEAWSLLGRSAVKAPLPRTAGPIVDHYIDTHHFRACGLAPRAY